MDYSKLQKVCFDAIKMYGSKLQLRQLQEECSELAIAVSHFVREREGARDEMIEEMADVYICLRQAIFILGCCDDFNVAVDLKIDRLEDRLSR